MQRLLITGGSSGLGLHLVRYFCNDGYHVFSVSRRDPGLKLQSNFTHLPFDLSQVDQIENCARFAAKLSLDGVLHALGGGLGMKSASLTVSELDTLLRVNFSAGYFINQAVIEAHDKKKSLSIVHFDSVATSEVTASLGYTLAKSMLRPYVKHLARSLVRDNVYISNIQLGGIIGLDGAMDRLKARDPKVFQDFIDKRRPSGRLTPVDELTVFVKLLISDVGKIHTGNTLTLDESELSAI